jgi:IS30 family transposase
MPGQHITETQEAQVIALLMAGERTNDIVKQTGVSHSTISRIRRSLAPDVYAQLQADRFTRIQDAVVDHLEIQLETMAEIATQFHDADWRRQQDAQALATSYGIFSDKSVRIFEAIETANIAREEAVRRRELPTTAGEE